MYKALGKRVKWGVSEDSVDCIVLLPVISACATLYPPAIAKEKWKASLEKLAWAWEGKY